MNGKADGFETVHLNTAMQQLSLTDVSRGAI